MLIQPIKRRAVLNPFLVFRSAISGRYVSRLFALMNPSVTYSQKRWPK